MKSPGPQYATGLVNEVTGVPPDFVTRFGNGTRHYVYDIRLATGDCVVLRIGDRSAHNEMSGALELSELLRPLGVPLPMILAEDTKADFPWLLLERLPGTDLGEVISRLSENQLSAIAAGVAGTQAIVAKTRSLSRYGYAVKPADAPFATWSEVLAASIDRSITQMAAARLFDPALGGLLHEILQAERGQFDAVAATPFLHDTTTKNVIVSPRGYLSGIVDVDNLCYGDPRYAAALTLAVLMGYGGPTEYVTSWLSFSDHKDDSLFRFYVAVFVLDLMAEHGQIFNGNEKPSCPQDRAKLRCAFESCMEQLRT